MSGNRWDQSGVPHKGWHCVDVVDLRADGESADETDYATCQMCGNEKIRYVHIMEHPDLDENFEVGCVCAEKMSDDYDGPKRRGCRALRRGVRPHRQPLRPPVATFLGHGGQRSGPVAQRLRGGRPAWLPGGALA